MGERRRWIAYELIYVDIGRSGARLMRRDHSMARLLRRGFWLVAQLRRPVESYEVVTRANP